MSELGDLLDRLAATLGRPFSIVSEWDDGFVLSVDGRKSVHDSFAEAAGSLLLSRPPPRSPESNVFDAVYHSEIDTTLSFDGKAFTAVLQSGQCGRFRSFDEAQRWLDAEIRRAYPRSDYENDSRRETP